MALLLSKSNQAENKLIRLLMHGDSGIGKTTAITTLPHETTLVVLAEPKALPLADFAFDCITVKSWEDCTELLAMLKAPATKEFNPAKYKTVVFDSLTAISDLLKVQITNTDRRELLMARSKGARDTPDNIYEDQLSMEDYGLYRTRIMNFVRDANSLPMHVVFTALSLWREDKETGEKIRLPDLQGKAAVEIGRLFDFVFYMCEKSKTVEGAITHARVFQTDKAKGIAAKGSPKLAQYVLPNLSDVFRDLLTPADANKTNKTAKTAGNEAAA